MKVERFPAARHPLCRCPDKAGLWGTTVVDEQPDCRWHTVIDSAMGRTLVDQLVKGQIA